MGKEMAIREINVERFSLTSSKTFQDIVAGLEKKISRPDMNKFFKDVAASRTDDDLKRVVHDAVGPADLMEFARFDQGAVLRMELGDKAPQVLRLVAGNPLIMRQMVKRVPDAGSYAPVTILIDERPDGVHLSYDTMANFIQSFGNAEALQVAHALDSKDERL